jgi:hypothetical protein
MTNYWVVPTYDTSGTFHCFYYDNDWKTLVTGPLNCRGPVFASEFLSLVADTSPPASAPPLPHGYTIATNVSLLGSVANTLSPHNYLQQFFQAITVAGPGQAPLAGLVLPVIRGTSRGVILVFAVKDAMGCVLGLVASKDPEIKNSTAVDDDLA